MNINLSKTDLQHTNIPNRPNDNIEQENTSADNIQRENVQQDNVSVNKPNNKQTYRVRKVTIFIFALVVLIPCMIIYSITLMLTPIITLIGEPKACHYCIKNISRNNDDYQLKKAFIFKKKLRCDYINNNGKILNDYKKGIKIKQECTYGLSIGLSIVAVLLISSIYTLISCTCMMFLDGRCDKEGCVPVMDFKGYFKLSDLLCALCWPIIILNCRTIKVKVKLHPQESAV